MLGAAMGGTVSSDPFHQLDEAGVRFRDELYGGDRSLPALVRSHAKLFSAGVVKDPNFIFFAPHLPEAFPAAKFVFIVRDPRDNIRSILNRLRLPAEPSETDSAEISDTWRRVLDGLTPTVEGSNYLERLAARWVMAVRCYRDHAEWMHLVKYERFNVSKVDTIVACLRDLGLPHDGDFEALLDRQFQSRGDRTISWQEFFGTKGLRIIEGTCAAEMRTLGYARSGQS